uniref:RNA-dependent RNA polymerase n=1 Tax=Anthurium amnicola TaxID=1678845 RepID=A0A1D1Y120_9ARAE
MGGKTIQVSGFPLNVGDEQVKEFLESHTCRGTIYALKVRHPKVMKWNSRDYAVVQFTESKFAKIILSKAQHRLMYGDSYLKAREMERDIVPKPRENMFELSECTLHFGCQVSQDRLSVLFKSTSVEVKFGKNMRKIHFFLSWRDREYKLEFSYESIWEIQLCHSSFQHKDFLMFLVAAAPRIYLKPPQSLGHINGDLRNFFKDYPDDQWIRTTDFTPACCIGQSSAFCVELPYNSYLPDIAQIFCYFKEFDRYLHLVNCRPYSHSLDIVPIVQPSPGTKVPYKILFKVNHMVQNGTLSGPTLDDRFFRLLNPDSIPSNYIERALEHLSYSKSCKFDPANWLLQQYEKYRKSKRQPESGEIKLEPGLVYVRRVQVTPSKIYFYGPEVNVSNRVVRHYTEDLDNFIRVSFVDEDAEKMRSTDLSPRVASVDNNKHTDIYRRILSTLKNGIVVGDRKFDFLAFSSSQLRENSAWLFASRTGLDAADIRRWMGDFRSIRNVAKYAARLGQSFSSSTETLSVHKHEVEVIPDVKNGEGYVFSDGIGKISAEFARRVAIKCNLKSETPSAFQIRYGGYKGVVAVDKRSTMKLSLRKSMCKFESDNTKLDVLSYSKYQPCYLNRQLITLLSTLGVRDQVFEMKQEAAVNELDEILTDPLKAQEVLETMFPGEMTNILKEMLLCGYKPDMEPFLSMMLQTFRASKLWDLRTRTRIFLPKGRAMMGCLDETSTLQYGQVFVGCRQFKDSDLYMFSRSESEHQTVVLGRVIVAKNPCLHPGDVRILLAVDVPELHHMVDCVVFPQKGKRPHPNECSGSDLDGDIYFVSWDPVLIPSRQVPAMDYTAAPQEILDHDVSIEEVQEYFTNYLVNDSLGIIANAHTVFADKEPKKAESDECIELARLFSIAVDFPKTGVPAEIPAHLQVKEYPDFMEKLDRETYKSKGVIGKLFRAIKDHAPHLGQIKEFTKRDAMRCYDPDMEVPGFKNHLDDAFFFKGEYDYKLGNLMDHYEIKTEAEVLSGNIMKMSKTFNRYKDGEALRLALRSLRKEARGWFNEKGGIHDQDEDAVYAKASAWYHVTYHPDYWGQYNAEGFNRPHFLSFPWCVYDKLIHIKQRNMSRQRADLLTHRMVTSLRLG